MLTELFHQFNQLLYKFKYWKYTQYGILKVNQLNNFRNHDTSKPNIDHVNEIIPSLKGIKIILYNILVHMLNTINEKKIKKK